MFGGVHDQGDLWWTKHCCIGPLVPDRGSAGQPAGLVAAAAHRLIKVSNPEDVGSIRANAVAACNGVPGSQRLFER